MSFKPTTLRGLLAGLACLLSASTLAAMPGYDLPDLGQPSDNYMSPTKAHKLGKQVIAQLMGRGMVLQDPELEEYLNSVGRRLAAHTDRKPDDFHFYVIDNPAINAFALPGGYIGVHAGLIPETQDESQLASVMAHEIAHVVQHHIARQMEESHGDTLATMAAALAAAIAGAAAGSADAAGAAMTAGMAHIGQQQTNFTRAHEYEADRVGIRILAASHYDPKAMAQFFGMLQRNADLYGHQLPQILLTHPVDTTRMAEAQARAAQYPHPHVHANPDYPFMKERARVLESDSMSDLENYYERQIVAPDTTPAERYGYALTLTRLGRTAKAIQILQPQAKAHPDALPWTLALADAESNAGHLARAKTILDQARPRFPKSDALKYAYAQSLEDTGHPKAMRNYLLSQQHLLDTMPEAQKLLAEGAGKQGNLGEAYYRQARYYAMRDNYPAAIDQLRTALQTVKLSSYDKSRLSALRDQMVVACHKAWSVRKCRDQVKADTTFSSPSNF